MKTLLVSWCLLGLAFALEAQVPEPELKIQVLVYNYAGVSAGTLARAERESVRIYARIGLAVEWLNCPLTAEEAERNRLCEPHVSPPRFHLRLLSNSMAKGLPPGRDISGLALLPDDGGFGVTASVRADVAQEMEDPYERCPGIVLGHLMAHELGHLLLGSSEHPATGIMHTPWRMQELKRVKQGVMFFLPAQAQRIRAQVTARKSGDPIAPASQQRSDH